jgi:hypothetical protein
MEITQDELLAGFQELATENAILRRRLAIKDQQLQELTGALNTQALAAVPVGHQVVVDAQGNQVADPREQGTLAEQRAAHGEPDGETALKEAYRLSDQVLKMHALSPDDEVRKKALAELLGREATADELADPERTLAGLYEADQGKDSATR